MKILENLNNMITTIGDDYLVLILKSILLLILSRVLYKIIVLIFTKKIKTSRKVFLFNKNISILINIISLIVLFII